MTVQPFSTESAAPRHPAGIALRRRAAVGVLAGLLAGLVAGTLSRFAMRYVALAAGMRPVLTLGTLVPLSIGLLAGAPFGLLFGLARPYLPGRRWGGWAAGLAFGLLIFLLCELPLFMWHPDLRAELRLAPGYAGYVLFGTLPFAYGLVVGAVADRLDRRLPIPVAPRSAAAVAYTAISAIGFASLGLIVYGIYLAVRDAGR